MEVILECPLGSRCEYIGDDKKIHRCHWYTKMTGMAQDGSSYDESRCAIAWQPILMVENSAQTRSAAAAIESLRNETIKRQDAALSAVRGISNAKEITDI